MPTITNKLDQMERMNPQERVKTFSEIHESEDEVINNFLNIILKSSRKIAFEYLSFCSEKIDQKSIENLHYLVCNPRFRFREKVLDYLTILRLDSSPDILLNLYQNSGIQFRKKILTALISWNFTTAPKILLNILSQSEPELLALSLEILGNCNAISNTESIENLLDHPVPLVRKRAINVMLNLKKENWLISQLELIPQLDSCRQEDILECCLDRTEKINLHLVLHDELPDNWIHQLLKAWPKSSNYTDQLAVLNLVANKSQRSSLTALKWLIKQNIDPQLGADIYELLSNEKYQIFHNMLLKLFCCIPLSYCLSEWKYLSKNSESELVENFFRSQLRIHLQETPVELYLQELLNSTNVIELIRALECLPSEKIDTKFLENLKNHSNEEVIKSVNRHLV